MTLFAIQFAIFAGFVNMMKMVYLKCCTKGKIKEFDDGLGILRWI